MANPRSNLLHRVDRHTLVVEDHVRRIEIDANTFDERHEPGEIVCGLLSCLENELDILLLADVAERLHAIEILLERRLVVFVEETCVH